MTIPMIVLAIGALVLAFVLNAGGKFVTWLAPSVGEAAHIEPVLSVPVITIITLVLVVLGVFVAFRMFAMRTVPVEAPDAGVLVRAARRDLYQDPVNENLVLLPGQVLTSTLVYADRAAVDATVLGLAAGVHKTGSVLRKAQNGYVRTYAATSLGGLLVVAAVIWALA
jgi:NADH-quinone oxidoreductase subunit L